MLRPVTLRQMSSLARSKLSAKPRSSDEQLTCPSFRRICIESQVVEAIVTARPANEIPGPVRLPFLGTLHRYLPGGGYSFKKSIPTGLKKLEEYGPICREEFGAGRFMVQLFDPEDFRTVLQQEGKYPRRLALEAVAFYFKQRNLKEIASSNGEAWQTYRSKVQSHMLKLTNVETYVPLQDTVAEDFVKLMKVKIASEKGSNGEIANYLKELYKWSMESIGVVCFDARLQTLKADLEENSEADCFIRKVHEFFEAFGDSLYTFSLLKHRSLTYRKLASALDYMTSVSEKYVNLARERSAKFIEGKGEELSLGLLGDPSQTLLFQLASNPKVTRDELAIIIFSLFFAAVESTANTLCFNLYQLAKNPDKQELVYREICDHNPRGQPTTVDSLRNLKYLKAAVRETSRLTPTAATIVRILDHDIVLKGYTIPAGYGIFLNHGAASRLPEFFPEPERFLPERWLRNGSGETREQHHPFSALQFGFGPRSCIGRRFAEQELHLGLVKILQHFRVEYPEDEVIGMEMRGLEKPTEPIRFRFIDRTE